MKIELASYTSLGCVINNRDYLISTEKRDRKKLTNIDKYAVKLGLREASKMVHEALAIRREASLCTESIKEDLEGLNSKYKKLRYGWVDFKNPFLYYLNIVMQDSKYTLSYLPFMEKSLQERYLKAIDYCYEQCENSDYMTSTELKNFGKEARYGLSIYDNAVWYS